MFVTGVFTIDWTTQLVTVADTEDVVIAQDVFNALRLAEVQNEGMQYGQIIEGSGKVGLTPGVATSIDAKLLEEWKVVSAKTSGVFTVRDGNVVHWRDGDDIFASNVLVDQNNVLSQAGVSVEGLDAAVANALMTELLRLVKARKITRVSPDPESAVPGTMELYDADTLALIDAVDIFEDEDKAVGYRRRGIDWQDGVT